MAAFGGGFVAHLCTRGTWAKMTRVRGGVVTNLVAAAVTATRRCHEGLLTTRNAHRRQPARTRHSHFLGARLARAHVTARLAFVIAARQMAATNFATRRTLTVAALATALMVSALAIARTACLTVQLGATRLSRLFGGPTTTAFGDSETTLARTLVAECRALVPARHELVACVVTLGQFHVAAQRIQRPAARARTAALKLTRRARWRVAASRARVHPAAECADARCVAHHGAGTARQLFGRKSAARAAAHRLQWARRARAGVTREAAGVATRQRTRARHATRVAGLAAAHHTRLGAAAPAGRHELQRARGTRSGVARERTPMLAIEQQLVAQLAAAVWSCKVVVGRVAAQVCPAAVAQVPVGRGSVRRSAFRTGPRGVSEREVFLGQRARRAGALRGPTLSAREMEGFIARATRPDGRAAVDGFQTHQARKTLGVEERFVHRRERHLFLVTTVYCFCCVVEGVMFQLSFGTSSDGLRCV